MVAWTFRHLPLESNYPNAPQIAHASECVAEIGGNEAFWNFSDTLFEDRGSIELTRISRLPRYAETAGVDTNELNACMERNEYSETIATSAEDAFRSGAPGVPYTVVMAGEEIGVINGPQPYNELRQVIEEVLAGSELDSSIDI